MIISSPITSFSPEITADKRAELIEQLEKGAVLHFNQLPFVLEANEALFLNTQIISPNRKNISYDVNQHLTKGLHPSIAPMERLKFIAMMRRFVNASTELVKKTFPPYAPHLEIGRTSFRPIEIATRAPLSDQKDDRLLHVDSFPATPVAGKRILRLFSNIHPTDTPRAWRLGKNFSEVVDAFIPRIKKPFPLSRQVKQLLKLTRGYQTLYDYYMLGLHNTMKMDSDYQAKYPEIYELAPRTTWLVFTDVAPHAAMAGQYLLEQTFYLPPECMAQPERSPLAILEKALKMPLLQ